MYTYTACPRRPSMAQDGLWPRLVPFSVLECSTARLLYCPLCVCVKIARRTMTSPDTPFGGEVLHVCLQMSRTRHPM